MPISVAYPANFSRSAVAPVMSAGVMIAKVIWKARNSGSGIPPVKAANCLELMVMSWKPAKSKPPNQPPSPRLPKAMEAPNSTQRTASKPMAK